MYYLYLNNKSHKCQNWFLLIIIDRPIFQKKTKGFLLRISKFLCWHCSKWQKLFNLLAISPTLTKILIDLYSEGLLPTTFLELCTLEYCKFLHSALRQTKPYFLSGQIHTINAFCNDPQHFQTLYVIFWFEYIILQRTCFYKNGFSGILKNPKIFT